MKVLKLSLIALMLLLNTIIKAQDNCTGYDELNRKRHQIAGGQYGHPYTIFDRKNGFPFDSTIQIIRATIITASLNIDKGPIYETYKGLYKDAIKPINTTDDDGFKKKVNGVYTFSELPYWAKNNAFVFLIGLDSNGNYLDTLDPTGATRNAFRDRALQGFDNITGSVDAEKPSPLWFISGLVGQVTYGALQLYKAEIFLDEMQHYSESIMFWLQCYDLLKGAYEVPELRSAGRNPYGFGDADRNQGKCSPRNRLRRMVRDFYMYSENFDGLVEHKYGWKKNHGIKAASTLLMAAQVLNDAGVETSYVGGVLGFLKGKGMQIARPNYSPINWNKLGYEGLRENLFVGKHWWPARDVPQSPLNTTSDSYSPYAEGPDYANYGLLRSGLPAMRAQANFYPATATEVLLNQHEIKNIFNWFDTISTPSGLIPSFDNAKSYKTNILCLTGNDKFNKGISNGFNVSNYADYVAIVAGNNMAVTISTKADVVNLENAGNIIINSINKEKQHQLVMLNETGDAVDVSANDFTEKETHEEVDFASFMIHANDVQLALDPAYFGWGSRAKTNKFDHHNVFYLKAYDNRVVFLPQSNNVTTYNNGFVLKYKSKISPNFSGTTNFWQDFFEQMRNWGQGQNPVSNILLSREATKHELADGTLYYVLRDKGITDETDINGLHWQLNGNGYVGNNTYSFDATKSLSTWNNGCNKLIHHFALLDGINYPPTVSWQVGENYQQVAGNSHTRLVLTQSKRNTLVQSVLLPFLCYPDSLLPLITKTETPNYVFTLVQSQTTIDTLVGKLGKSNAPVLTGPIDIVSNFHFGQLKTASATVPDPLNNSSLDTLKTNATNIMLSMGTYTKVALGACSNSRVKFKRASLTDGTYLAYNDTNYISATDTLYADYKLISKFKYEAYVDPGTQSAGVTFYLPDAESGYTMTAKIGDNELPNVYNDSLFTIAVTITSPTKFTIELADPCQADCFFPPTNEPIDTLYVFDTGSKEVLGHDLDIIQPSGELQITKGSKMSICSDFVFTNKDTLKLFAIDGENSHIYENPMDGIGTISTPVRNRIATKRSMIIVNDKAALVLDSGSFTHVGDNSTILVLKGGTLLIRKGAIVEIGGNEVKSPKAFGEIIAEEGSYVCIEDSSDIYFFADTPTVDTTDNNVFFVRLTGSLPTVAGTNPDGGMGKFTYNPVTKVTGIYANSNCIPFCDLKTYRPLHGINNRDFGWCNFSTPVARLIFPTLTCANIPILLKEYSVLNETYYKLDIYGNNGLFYSKESTSDSPRFNTLMLPSLNEAGSYSINFDVSNDCAETDNLSKTISIAPKPVAAFTVNATGCEGVGTITANGSASGAPTTPVKHLWYVQRLDSAYLDTLGALQPDDYTQEWAIDTLMDVDSSFAFPGFKWKGGYRYLVGLTVYGVCSDSTVMDTVHIPLGINILRDSLKIYPNLGGYTNVQIKTKGSGYSSFSWSPTTGLTNSNTLNPTAAPNTTTKYTLTAVSGSCTVKDSVVVKVLDCAKAGFDQTICKGDTTFIGFYGYPCPPNTLCYSSTCALTLLWKADSTLANVNSSGTNVWPSVTTTYTLYALLEQAGADEPPPTPIYDTLEYDHITVYVDTLPGTLFGINYQTDSTVYFSNYTQTINGASYLWIFGDGDSSTAINPIHTFPAFDSSYRVCLQATNACGMRQHCDTVWVDSLHIGMYAFGKRGNTNESLVWVDETTPTNKPQQLFNQNILGNNKPNPFNHTTQIDYELKPDYKTASITITNTLSQLIQTIPLVALKGSVVLDANTLQKGMYYYQLVVDGKLVAVKRMVVQ